MQSAPVGSRSEVEPRLIPLSQVMAKQRDGIGLSCSMASLRSVRRQLDTIRALESGQSEKAAGEMGGHLYDDRSHPSLASTLLLSARQCAQRLGMSRHRAGEEE